VWTGTPQVGDWVIYGPPAYASGGHIDIVVAVNEPFITVAGGDVSNKVTKRTNEPLTQRSVPLTPRSRDTCRRPAPEPRHSASREAAPGITRSAALFPNEVAGRSDPRDRLSGIG